METSEQPQLPSDDVDAKLEELCTSGANFEEWTSFIAEIEKTSPIDIVKISSVYDSFLSEFPLCYGYWRKYAAHKAQLCTADKVVEVYERALQSATYSVDLWVDYCCFGVLLFEDTVKVQRLFERGVSFVGKDYLCSRLWDKYIEFQYSQKNWSSLAHIYIRTLKFPTKKLHSYYASFKKLVAIWEEEIKFQNNDAAEVHSDATPNDEIAHAKASTNEDMTSVIKDLLDPTVGSHRHSALQKYLSAGNQLYQEASELDAKICFFESQIRRPYFHVKPLDVSQLENWHQYLDFVEMHGDFDWTVKLHERCLIPCANYPEFWMRYTELMETKRGKELADFALIRATQIFLKRVPAIHLFCARFKEKTGDIFGSRDALRQCGSELDPDLIENVRREANMERRLGNLESAFRIYEEALQMAIQKQRSQVFSMLSVHFSRYKYMVIGKVDASRDVLIKGIQHFPYCKLLIQELLNFEMMHKSPKQLNLVGSIVTRAIFPGSDISQGLTEKDREDISNLYLEFLDHCGTIHDLMKAWNYHRKLFPHSVRPTSHGHAAGKQDMAIALCHHSSLNEKPNGSIETLQLDNRSSQPENPDIQPDYAATVQTPFVGVDSTNEKLQPLASPKVMEQSEKDLKKQNLEVNLQPLASPKVMEQSEKDLKKQNLEVNDLVDEVGNDRQALMTSQEPQEGVSEVRKVSSYDSNDYLRPPSLASLSLSPQFDKTEDSNPTTSNDCGTVPTTSKSNGNRQHDDAYSNQVSSLSSPMGTKSDTQGLVKSHYGSSRIPSDPGSLGMDQHSQPVLPRPSRFNQSFVNGEKRIKRNYVGKALGNANTRVTAPHSSQHPQQLQHSSQPRYQPSHPQNFGNQNFSSQPQTWQNTLLQPSHQTQNQHQVQPMSAYQWPAQSMPQQYFATDTQPQPQPQQISQSVGYPQPQAYPYPLQSNVQYAHMQANPAFTQMWYYYQQQQQQQQIQQFPTVQTQAWNGNYYQQQPPVQQYGSTQYGLEYVQQQVQPQVQGTAQPTIEASGPSVSPYPQQTWSNMVASGSSMSPYPQLTQLNIEASGASVSPYPQPTQPNLGATGPSVSPYPQHPTRRNIETSGPSGSSHPPQTQPNTEASGPSVSLHPHPQPTHLNIEASGPSESSHPHSQLTQPNIEAPGPSVSSHPQSTQLTIEATGPLVSTYPQSSQTNIEASGPSVSSDQSTQQNVEASEPSASLYPQKTQPNVEASGPSASPNVEASGPSASPFLQQTQPNVEASEPSVFPYPPQTPSTE